MTPLRILYLEDNPLIAFHVEQMIQDSGHIFVAALQSFLELKDHFASMEIDAALVDIDLADGRTGPLAAEWLQGRNVPVIFVTGQDGVALDFVRFANAIVKKPITESDLVATLEALGRA